MTNKFAWSYPIYLVRHAGGYASVALQGEGDEPRYALTVFTTEELGDKFVETVGIDGECWSLRNDREFARVLCGLSGPFAEVVFDAAPIETEINEKWRVSAQDLLENYLPLANSPWDYPVYVLRDIDKTGQSGYVSIEADIPERGHLIALALFTTQDTAVAYGEAAGINGPHECIETPEQLATLLRELSETTTAVAWEPTVVEGKSVTKQCASVTVLLEKYLAGF